MQAFVRKAGIVFNSVKMIRSIGLSDLWAIFSQNSLPCVKTVSDISLLKFICDYSICLHNQKNSSWNSKQKDNHFTKLNIYSEVIVYPAFV